MDVEVAGNECATDVNIDVRHLCIIRDVQHLRASFAIDYAIASIEQAKLAVFDAIFARLDAEAAKTARKTTA